MLAPSPLWHSGWFGELGCALAVAGVTTVAVDAVGSGRSECLDGVRGFVRGLEDYVADLAAAVARMAEELAEGTAVKGSDLVEGALRKGELKMRNVLVLHKKEDVRRDCEVSQRFVEGVVCEGRKEFVGMEGPGHQLFQDKAEVTQEAIERVVEFVVDVAKTEVGSSTQDTVQRRRFEII